MLIYFDYDVNSLVASDTRLLASAMSELLRAHRLGLHLLAVRPPEVKWIIERIGSDLKADELAILRQIGHEYSQTAALITQATRLLVVRPLAGRPEAVSNREVVIGLKDIERSRLLEEVVLVVEDSASDGILYKHMLRWLAETLSIPVRPPIIVHGGGSRISKVFEEYVDDGRNVCVISDSDKDSARSPDSIKLRKLKNLPINKHWPIAVVLVPNCREVENIIPYEIARSLVKDPIQLSSILALECIQRAEASLKIAACDHFWLFFDIKKGLNDRSLRKIKCEYARPWLEEKIRLANLKPEEFSIAGFGDNIVNQVFASGRATNDLRKIFKAADWWKTFGSFSHDLMWTCLAKPRQIT
jgi:hypothetical protein